MAQPRIAVIGAGLAGLAAAVRLAEAGCAVELFERSRLLGGRATSFVVGGREVDNGQHVFLACCTEFIDFVQRIGFGDRLRIQPRFAAVMFGRGGSPNRLRAAPLPAPWHLAVALLGFRLLGWRSKVRVARALAGARRGARSDETFADWLDRNGQGAPELRAFWEPFFVPALNAPLDAVPATDAIAVIDRAFLHDASAARFGYSTVPLAHIAAAAAERAMQVHLSTPVVALEVDPSGSRCSGIRIGSGERLDFDAVVAALTPPQLARLLGEPRRFGVSDLERYQPFPIVDVHLWHDRGAIGLDFAALIGSPVQWIFEKASGYLCCSISAAGEFLTMPTEALERLCWNEAVSTLPTLRGAKLVDAAVTRNPEATYLPAAGLKRAGARTALDNFAVAGSWTATGWPDTMESAVRSGRAAARKLLETLGGKSEGTGIPRSYLTRLPHSAVGSA